MAKAQSRKIKGVILAGGLGTRLLPLTRITNKHLLPIYDKPMILYPLNTLKQSGVDEILIVCGRERVGDFMNFLGSGSEYEMRFTYKVQDKNDGGIADALRYAEAFSDGGSLAVILGDNIFEQHFAKDVDNFGGGAKVFFKKVRDPSRFGVPVFNKSRSRILRIEEKPKRPKSNLGQTGFYLYDSTVFSKIRSICPSARGQLELTDVNNLYLKEGALSFNTVNGFWSDAGTFSSLFESTAWAADKYRNV